MTPTSVEVPLQVRLAGTATPGVDYNVTSTSSSRLVITILEDPFPEADETVVLTLTETDAYLVGAPQTYTLTIRDNDTSRDPGEFGFASSTLDQSWIQGMPVDTILPAAVYGRAPYTYTLTRALPAGLRFDALTRAFNGNPHRGRSCIGVHLYGYGCGSIDGHADLYH